MNRRGTIAIGPGAASLILIFVALGMSVLGMLSLMSAKNDLNLSERSRDVTVSVYTLFSQAEEKLALLDDAARAGETDFSALLGAPASAAENQVSFSLSDGGRTLELTARLPQAPGEHAVWTRHILLSRTEEEEEEGGGFSEDFFGYPEEEGDTEWN